MIYLCSDYRSATLGELLSVIPKSERLRINRIKNPDKQLQSAAAWALLSKIANLDEKTETARYDDGKPYILGAKKFFSLSHCESCVAAAVSDERVGIDAEKIAADYPKDVASRFFSEKTRREIADSDDPAREFYIRWTQYESFVKAFGADADFSGADGTLFKSEVINGVALSACCKTNHEIKTVSISEVLSRNRHGV